MDKSGQRRFLRAVRDGLSPGERLEKSAAIAGLLTGCGAYKNADTVMTYVSFGSEVSTDLILEKIRNDGKTAAVPLCGKNRDMTARVIKSKDELRPGAYGVPEPSVESPVIGKNNIDLIIVPGLGFDKNGFRIGYGKGYYDRYLSGFEGASIGLCFEACLLDRVFREETDQKTDIVITEKEIITAKLT